MAKILANFFVGFLYNNCIDGYYKNVLQQATDSGGKYGQTIVEVNVIPGPNTRSPVFKQSVYEVTVSEGAALNSTVATISVSNMFSQFKFWKTSVLICFFFHPYLPSKWEYFFLLKSRIRIGVAGNKLPIYSELRLNCGM